MNEEKTLGTILNAPLLEPFDFGQALKRLRLGRRVARAGWNGKGMWLILLPGGARVHWQGKNGYRVQDCIGMKTANNLLQPGWLASQNDMLAEDWVLVTD